MPNKCDIELKDGSSTKNNLKRNNYFKGKSLSAEDFTAEQNYVIDKIRRLSAKSNGFGIIEGFKIESVKKDKIVLNSGSGIDANGNLLLLSKKKTFDLTTKINKGDFIYLKYLERGSENVSVEDDEVCDDACCFNKIEEAFEVIVSKSLLTSSVANICEVKPLKKMFIAEKEGRDSLLLIGQYNLKGGVDYDQVNTLYKNSELSQLICKISQSYVSTLNGKTGDVFAVSSINNATPDEEGQLNFVAGNNISIESEGQDVTISSKNGFYRECYIKVLANDSSPINHYAKRFPIVDVYKQELDTSKKYQAIKDTELHQLARDTSKSFDEVKLDMQAISYEEHISSSETSHVINSREKVSSALFEIGVSELSPQVTKQSDLELSRAIDNIYIFPKYIYKKVVGSEDKDINIEVVHLNRNSLRLYNRTSSDISLLVILST